jgi:murein L,D-transpeptidase YafK
MVQLRNLIFLLMIPVAIAAEPYPGGDSPIRSNAPDRAEQALARVHPLLEPELAKLGLGWGDPVFMRAFKESAELELWMQPAPGKPFLLVRNYRIARLSGGLGPKVAEGDGQTPEGFYAFDRGSLNPRSNYHLSFNIGYPNSYDRANGRTGGLIMVHGFNVSIGCYAMTNDSIEQIYSLVAAALENGQSSVTLHSFPFRMTLERLAKSTNDKWFNFWTDLAPAYTAFEASKLPPEVQVCGKTYRIVPATP